MAEISEIEQHVLAASYHVLKALQATKNLTNDTRSFLGDLDIHLSTMMRLNEAAAEDNREIETRLMSAQHTIMTFHSKIRASNPAIPPEYLQAVSEVQILISTLANRPLNRYTRAKELYDQAQSIIQIAMDRLQTELIYILAHNKYILAHNKQCFESQFDESITSNEDDSIENASSSTGSDECVMDLIHPDVIPQIKSIADVMLTSGYGPEFRQAFEGFWRDTLAEYLTILDVKQLSIEDVLRMEWECLNSRIRRWRVAVKSIIGLFLVKAKCLFDQVLGEYGHKGLIEASKGPVLSLLNFGQAVAIGPHGPEWLFCLLDMYEVLAALVQDVDNLFPGSTVRMEFHELLTQLGDLAKAIFKDIGNHIESCSSTTPVINGGTHPLTKYLVNYILCFSEYGPTLDFLLQDNGLNPSSEVATHLQSLTSILEANLEQKSILYKDCPLKHIFMMNNIHYMVQKIKNSKIGPCFGDNWIRTHVVKYRQHAISYERLTWSSILTLLHDDGRTGKAALKMRSRAFITGFEELYKAQTRWLVPDLQLREEMRISASKLVIQAYRNFVEKITNSIGEKYIKYSEQELVTYILDLLEGSPKSLNHSRKR